MSEPSDGNGGEKRPRYAVHFLKSQHFRVIHADGAWGGVTPHNQLSVTFYSERPPIPQRVVHDLEPLGAGRYRLGEEIERQGKQGAVRELETSLILSVETAKSIVEWLKRKIEEAEKQGNKESDS